MRLIDADLMIKLVNELYARKRLKTAKFGQSVLLEFIERMPTVEQPKIIRCKDCKWFNDIGCAIKINDDSDKPSETDFCSFAETE